MARLSMSPKPCPLCGGEPLSHDMKTGTLHVGNMTSDRFGVRCLDCRVQVDEPIPDRWPKDTPKKLKGMAACRWLGRRMLKIAIERWNQLPRLMPAPKKQVQKSPWRPS